MRKLLVAVVLLNSVSVMASESGLPDFEEVKRGFLSTDLTIDRHSKAGEEFGRAVRLDWNREGIKDDEASLLRAVQLGHAYAPRVLYHEYKNEPYRGLLLAAVSKKIENCFEAGIKEDMALLGHILLAKNNYSLAKIFQDASFVPEEYTAKRINYFHYLIDSTWRELEAHIVDLDQAETIISLARQSLKNLADKEESEACVALGRLAVKEKNLEEAKKHLLSEKTLAFIENEWGNAREDWAQAVKGYIALVNDPEKLEAYQALGGVYKNKSQYMDAFEAFFEAYKHVPQSSDKTHQNALFIECANIFQISQRELDSEWDPRAQVSRPQKVGGYRFLGYRFYAELSERGVEGSDDMASEYLKKAITEGYTPALSEILDNGKTIFQTPLENVKFLEALVTTEWEKAQDSERKLKTWNPNRESVYYQFKDHPVEVIKALEAKLLSFFAQAQENEFDLKLSASQSLIRRLGIAFNNVTSGEVLEDSDDKTALFLRDHREILNFMRTVDLTHVPEKDRDWFKRTQASIERIFKDGIRFEKKTESKIMYDFLGSYKTHKIIEGFIFEPEKKLN